MRNRLTSKIFFSFIILTLIIFFIFSLITINTIRKNYISTIKEEMEKLACSIVYFVSQGFQNPDSLDKIAKNLGNLSGIRITFISSNGKVLGDSYESPEKMEDHSTRIEVIQALNGKTGYSIRFSKTLNKNMIYIAKPVYSDDKIIGVVRVSKFINDLNLIMKSVELNLIFTFLTIIILYITVFSFFIRRTTEPIVMLKEATDKISKGDFNIRLNINTGDEIQILSERFNKMAFELEKIFCELERRREEIETILSAIQEGILVIDKDGRIIRWNSNIEDILKSISYGRYYWEVFKDNEFIDFVRSNMNTTNSFTKEFNINNRIFECYVRKIKDSENLLISFYDITERKRIEKIKKELVDNISHELRTPLTAIRGYLETMKNLRGENKKYLDIALKNTIRLINIIKDLSTLSELENPEIKLDYEKVDLVYLAKDVLNIFKPKAKDKGIKIVFNQMNKIFIMCDRYMIEQVFINIIDNAIKYTDKGEIKISLGEEKENVKIEIEDTGIGIPEEQIPHIFERFYVVDKSRSRKLGGTGLGLSIVKHIIMLHKGNIEAQSKIGKGTKFIITLPKGL